MKARHILLLPGAAFLISATLCAQGRDDRWDTGVAGGSVLGQAITLAGGSSVSVPPVSEAVPVGGSDSSSGSSSDSGSSWGSSYSSDYSSVGSAIATGLIGGRGSSRFFGPGDDDARWDYAEQRIDGIHGLWYGVRGIGRGIGHAASWVGSGIGSLFESSKRPQIYGCITGADGSVYRVWAKGYGKHYRAGIRRNGRTWTVKPAYEEVRLVSLHGAVAKINGYYGMIDPTDGQTLKDFDFVYDKYRGYYYPDGSFNFLCAFGQTSRNGMENWILAIPDGKGGFLRSTEEYADAQILADGAHYIRAVVKDHKGRISMLGGDGREILGPDYDVLRANGMVAGTPGEDGVAHYEIRTADEGKWGIADSQGNFVAAPMYEEITSWKQYGYRCRFDFGDWQGYNLIGLDGEEILSGMESISYDSWYDSASGELKIFLRVTDDEGVNWICNTAGEGLISDVPDGFTPSMLSADEQKLLGSWLEKYTIY